MDEIVSIYLKTGDFKEAVRLSGLPTLVAHIKLLSSGVLSIEDKINYGSEAARLGGEAEALFQKIMPEAVNANRYIRVNNPVFDFMYGDLTIDVKYSSFHQGAHWDFNTIGNQDLIVAFLERETGAKLKDPLVMVVPRGLWSKTKMSVIPDGEYFEAFHVPTDEVRDVIMAYHEVIYQRRPKA